VAAGYPKAQITHHASSATAARRVVREIQPGDAVLLKGSRGIKLETVAHAITKRITPAELSSRVG
jgi:UDP-N-acetylmuramyl pentapeptide synthase